MKRERYAAPGAVPRPVLSGPLRDPHAIVFEVARPEAAARAMESFTAGTPDGALVDVLRYYAENRERGARLTPVAPSDRASTWGHEGLELRLSAAEAGVAETARAGVFHLRLARPEHGEALLSRLRSALDGGDVSYAENPVIQYPLDSRAPRPAPVEVQWALDRCGFPGVWPELDEGEWTQPIAVIDQGSYMRHPELDGRVDVKDQVPRNPAAGDSPHATAVAAVIAAHRLPPSGIAGCCSAPVWMYDAWVSETGYDSLAYYKALEHVAASSEVKVVNLSLGSSEDDPCIRQQIAGCVAAGKLVVAAAGNKGAAQQRVYPAEYDGVIAVGATNKGDTKSSVSSNGTYVHISAPGTNIISTLGSSAFGYWNGTSFSAPMVAAAIAMAARKNPTLDLQGALDLLKQAAAKGNGQKQPGIGFGRLDVGKLAAVLASPPKE